MNKYFVPLASEPENHSEGGFTEAMKQDAMHIAWVVWTLHLLAELGCVGAVLAFYGSLIVSETSYLGWMAFAVYLLQGIHYGWVKTRKPLPPLKRTIWWRLVISILAWPVHQIIIEIHKDMIRARVQKPQKEIDSDWMQMTVGFAIIRWGGIWGVYLYLVIALAVLIDQVGLIAW